MGAIMGGGFYRSYLRCQGNYFSSVGHLRVISIAKLKLVP